MAAISASLVKELRDRTGLGMMDCKKALTECDGDIAKAIDQLRKSSGMKAAKKAGRTASEGLVAVKVAEDHSFGIVVEVNCETDFAARDSNFVDFAGHVADRVFQTRSTDLAGLLADGLEADREALVQKIGENVNIRRAETVDAEDARIGSYVHNGRIAVLTAMARGDDDLMKDVCMHIAASNPLVVAADDAPADLVAKETEIYTAQANESGKPPEVVEKMVAGRVRKFLQEISLLDQPFVKDQDVKVGALLKKADAEVRCFVRYEVGEGIEVEKGS